MRLALAFLLIACGGSRPPPEQPPIDAEESDDGAAIAGIELPPLPIDIALDDDVLTAGSTRAIEALSMPTPRPPEGDADELEAWANEELSNWIARRAQAAGDSQHALQSAREADDAHSVVASAILGLVYSRFALDLRGIPTPTLLARDAARAQEFRQALEHAADPLWQRAIDAFGSCANVASEAPMYSLAAWRTFCDEEIRQAQAMLHVGEDDEDDEDEEEDDDDDD